MLFYPLQITRNRMKEDSNDCIHTLWDELADFDAARADEALEHLMKGSASSSAHRMSTG